MTNPPPATPQQLQASRERAIFDAAFALSYALDNDIIAGVLVTREPRQLDENGIELCIGSIEPGICELILPLPEGSLDGTPNPSRIVRGKTPMSAFEKAGRVIAELIPNHPNGHAYATIAGSITAMRGKIIQSSTILKPSGN